MSNQRALYKLSLHDVPLYFISDSSKLNEAIKELLRYLGVIPPIQKKERSFVDDILMGNIETRVE